MESNVETEAVDVQIESAFDNVNHPKRYTRGKVECIDAQESAMCGKPADEAHCVAEVIGYLWRYDLKEPLRSIESAEWYLKRLKEKVQSRMSSGRARDLCDTELAHA